MVVNPPECQASVTFESVPAQIGGLESFASHGLHGIPEALVTIVFAAFSASISTAGAQQKLLAADQTQIVNTVSTIFTAARTDDVAKFDSVIASDFYIYDRGVRFDGDAVMAVIKALNAAGKRYEWSVTEPDVHISGNTAWIAYVNQGSITDASGTVSQK